MNEKKELFNVLLDLLSQFDKICRENDLEYSIFAGTLLGAIRHKGFIPWDDDIDIAMSRKDYNKLLQLSSDKIPVPYFLQTPTTDKGYHKGFARLRNSNTTEISYIDAVFECNHGAFIDIFPLDAVPDKSDEFLRQIKKLKKYVKLLHFAGRYNSGVGTLGLSRKKKYLYNLLVPLYKIGILNTKSIFEKYNSIASWYEDTATKRVGTICFSFDRERFIYDRIDYECGYDNLLFENLTVKGPHNYDNILIKSYGDYMVPVKQKTEHGDTLFDMKIPYRQYVAEHKQELRELWLSSRNEVN